MEIFYFDTIFQIEKYRMMQEDLEQRIQQSKLSLDQLKLEQNDVANR